MGTLKCAACRARRVAQTLVLAYSPKRVTAKIFQSLLFFPNGCGFKFATLMIRNNTKEAASARPCALEFARHTLKKEFTLELFGPQDYVQCFETDV